MTAGIAIVAVSVVALASMARDYRIQMKMADRVRVVSPPKQAEAPKDEAGTVEELDKRRAS